MKGSASLRKWRGPTGLLVALAAAASLLTATPAQAEGAVSPAVTPSASGLRVISWNICGDAGGTRDGTTPGYCPYRNEPWRKVDAIADLADKHQADVLMLQEACGYDKDAVEPAKVPKLSHMYRLAEEFAARGQQWTMVHAVNPRSGGEDPANCAGRDGGRGVLDGNVGVLLAVKGEISDVQITDLRPNGLTVEDFKGLLTEDELKNLDQPQATAHGAQQRPLLCARLTGRPDKLCTTHLTAGVKDKPIYEALRTIESRTLTSTLATDIGAGLVLGGDLNATAASATLEPFAGKLDRCANDAHTHQTWKPGNAAPSRYWLDHVFTTRRTAPRFTSCQVDQSLMDTTRMEGDEQSNPPSSVSDHAPVITYLGTPGDLDGDAKPDLLAIAGGTLRLHPGDGKGGLGAPVVIGQSGWSGASVTHRGDWTDDGREDIVARVGSELRLFRNRGGGTIAGHFKLATGVPTDTRILATGDISGDGYPDLVAVSGDKLYRYDGVRGAEPSVKAAVEIGTGGWKDMMMAAPGDSDRNGRPDLLARDAEDGQLWLYRGSGTGTFPFTDRVEYGRDYKTNRPLITSGGDANLDGKADMWATTDTGALLFYAGTAQGTGDGARTEVAPNGWAAVQSMS
ncbi:FG-GAP-like repeat-containing protein [Streptomyces sp. NPDC001549]|uniref:FG-GAP-like repeat-containing protein n=1 Tax=Streptomyces sp. NPDC001549 TaxID=3364586 RepID=UPI0036903D8D